MGTKGRKRSPREAAAFIPENSSDVVQWKHLPTFNEPAEKRMKALIAVYAISMLMATNVFANTQSATAEGVDKEVTVNRLMSKVPQGATVTNTSCADIGTAGFNVRYRCTITWQ